MADELPEQWEGRDIRIVGVVDALPQPAERGIRFEFAVERVLTAGALVPSRLSLAWYDATPRSRPAEPMRALQLSSPAARSSPSVPAIAQLHAGQRWQLTVRLKRPHGTVNPHGFDVEAWLLENNLRATGYVRNDESNARFTEFVGRPDDWIAVSRERIRSRILQTLDGRPYAGVIAALAIGDERAIPASQWQLFNRTGVGHLISISGLHITGFAALIGGIAYWVSRRSYALTSRMPARKIAALVGVFGAFVYVLLAGFEVPAQRTLYMLTVGAIGLWLGRPGTAAAVWLWALAVVLAYDPWSTLTPGFWLSFGAVALLLYIGVGRIGPASAWSTAVRAQTAISVGLIPLTLILFQQVSIVSPLANAVAIPVVTFVVVPLTLGSLLLPWDVLLVIAHQTFAAVAWLLDWLGSLPAAVWQQHAPTLPAVIAGILGVACLLAPRGIPGRWLGSLWLAPMFVVVPAAPSPGAFRVTVLDVGQGLAVLVQTHGHALLYDTGPRFSESADAGNRIVAPMLRAIGVPRLDGLVVSHQDSDHSGGALSVLQTVPTLSLWSSLPEHHPIVDTWEAHGERARRCVTGQRWRWDGVEFEILYPYEANYLDSRLKPNDLSCVLRISNAFGSALLAGDIEARDERLLVQHRATALQSSLLVVPHHGSMTSSTNEFIGAVRPVLAVFTPGYRNRFGHPRPEVVARYDAAGVRNYRTDYDGALTFEFDSTARYQPLREPLRQRDADRRYWRDAPSRVLLRPLD